VLDLDQSIPFQEIMENTVNFGVCGIFNLTAGNESDCHEVFNGLSKLKSSFKVSYRQLIY
jgi:hypothetical protein